MDLCEARRPLRASPLRFGIGRRLRPSRTAVDRNAERFFGPLMMKDGLAGLLTFRSRPAIDRFVWF
jgi:hypothetical protein